MTSGPVLVDLSPDGQEYLDNNLSALDKLSGDSCIIYILVDQGKSSEGGYVFIEKLNVLRKANLNIYSQLPGLFFWDRHEAAEFISFGPKPSIADIVFTLRVIFGPKFGPMS